MKKELAILFGITGDYAFALANVLTGLKRYSPRLADTVIVYHDGVSDNDQRCLSSILPCEFREYKPEWPLPDGRCSLLSFARFEGFDLLSEYRNVLWLDIDILIRGDLSDILRYRSSGIAAHYEPGRLSTLFPAEASKEEEFSEFDLARKFFNTGILLLSDELVDFTGKKQWLYSFVSRHSDLFHLTSDQGAINLMKQKFNLDITPLPAEYNNLICRDSRPEYQLLPNARIVHTITGNKFWNFWRSREWDENYKMWLAGGGSEHGEKRAGILKYGSARLFDWYVRLKKRSSRYRHPIRLLTKRCFS